MSQDYKLVRGKLVDLHRRSIYAAELLIEKGHISAIRPLADEAESVGYLLPGFVDAHIHIESSMLVPAEFAKKAVAFGSIATVSDPHEIANVLGMSGINFMLEDAARVPFKFTFGAPSCVPATSFETAGARLDLEELSQLLDRADIRYLSEMMNYPGVLQQNPEVMAKIEASLSRNKPVDGHAPGLSGEDAKRYAAAGISTDHECFTLEEARFKAALGMKILIREGSAARNFDALHPLLSEFPELVMFCSDDKHPDELMLGHINQLVVKALQLGYDLFDVLRAASVNPVEHYKLPVGLLRDGDPADFICVEDLEQFNLISSWIEGELVYHNGQCCFDAATAEPINHFVQPNISLSDLALPQVSGKYQVIEAIDGQLITNKLELELEATDSDYLTKMGIQKLVIINRYHAAPPALALIKGFGMHNAAMAGTVAHDSHNIIATGTDDELILKAIEAVCAQAGGLSGVSQSECRTLALPVAGLMSTQSCEQVAEAYLQLDKLIKASGSTLRAPYMTLSFMALLVIPALKLSDKGLFDGQKFQFTPLLTNT